MGLGGGGGGGGILGVGNAFTGPATALEIIGDHAYGYSGTIAASTYPVAPQVALEFTSGNFYLVGIINFDGNTRDGVPQTGVVASVCNVYFNDALIANMKTATSSETSPFSNWTDIIIPPYTIVKIEVDSTEDSASYWATVRLTGRIYRG